MPKRKGRKILRSQRRLGVELMSCETLNRYGSRIDLVVKVCLLVFPTWEYIQDECLTFKDTESGGPLIGRIFL